ncbi:MAG: hypothetical protein JW885_02665 [Deltaproteobacteria bacterium]|nr:hypothetical protein [Candidatus Zymogenaceae bacterium]
MAIPMFRNIQPGEHVMLMCGKDRLEVHVYGRCVMDCRELDAWGRFANARYGIPTFDFIDELIDIYSRERLKKEPVVVLMVSPVLKENLEV